ALPGVHLVLTAADLGDLNEPGPLLIPHPGLTHPRTQRPLAADRVRYVGELVAFVVAEDRYLAEDAVDLIEVEYEGGPAVIDLEHALDPAAPRADRRRHRGRVPARRARLTRAAHDRAELRKPDRGAGRRRRVGRARRHPPGVELDAGAASREERPGEDLRPPRVQRRRDRAR